MFSLFPRILRGLNNWWYSGGHEPGTFVEKVLSEPSVSDPTNEGNKTNYIKFKDRFI